MEGTGVSSGRQPRSFVRAPDFLTALRLPLSVVFLVVPDLRVRLIVLIVAAASDFVDGIWARRIGGSRLGVVLDPVCDKTFVVLAFVVVLRSGVLGPLELIGVLLRDLVAMLAFAATWALRKPTTLPARAGGKAVTVGQLLTLLAFLAGSDLLRPLAWATAAISVYAIADYTRAARTLRTSRRR
ncbi:MAG: CDP-alcohol phosphatidyltransferase family protein [Gemmatimonadota bacterium]|nr:CDP-alcohol phosphatidyltransferase family protein [Gemmatimonadota bacterium]MDH3368751.1 CDP-alcohol phosphatidyltransferase family protein [Gemmatimonadota bacterium]MDH3477937.1 CDP-alcohol phosphatidyltransferase family protein [Gemmatimonadota bacterium]MDH3571634.1 CDP-alcohol phosphatidyltransferase family protein [Gemmatimonadota bacterium]